MQLWNVTRSVEVAGSVEVAERSGERNKGLLGRDGLADGEGLWIVPCEAVHTFFMRFAIDLIYLDKDYRVRKLCPRVPPWRLSGCLRARSIVELAAGSIDRTQTQVGDVLEFRDVL